MFQLKEYEYPKETMLLSKYMAFRYVLPFTYRIQ